MPFLDETDGFSEGLIDIVASALVYEPLVAAGRGEHFWAGVERELASSVQDRAAEPASVSAAHGVVVVTPDVCAIAVGGAARKALGAGFSTRVAQSAPWRLANRL
jgi:hypothetical protein